MSACIDFIFKLVCLSIQIVDCIHSNQLHKLSFAPVHWSCSVCKLINYFSHFMAEEYLLFIEKQVTPLQAHRITNVSWQLRSLIHQLTTLIQCMKIHYSAHGRVLYYFSQNLIFKWQRRPHCCLADKSQL